MKATDIGVEELLKLLKSHPELISALVFDPASIKGLLKNKAARQMVLGVDTNAFLKYVDGPENGGPIVLCLQRTAVLSAPSTRCPGTKPPKHCRSPHTKPPPPCPPKRGTKPPSSAGGRAKR